MAAIHPTAVVSPDARLGQDVVIGPFAIVEEDVQIGDGCRLAGQVVVKQGTCLGPQCEVAEGTVLGGRPQHLRAGEQLGRLRIGRGNQIREYVTIHRGLTPEHDTCLGDGNLIMVGAHIAHDCRIGNQVIMANGVLLAGHVEVQDRAYLSGAVGVHQFCRIGRNAMVGGQAHLVQDVPPFVTVDGRSSLVVGLNLVGLRRSGMSNHEIRELKAAYRVIYRSGMRWDEMLVALQEQFTAGPAAEFLPFLTSGQRGFVQERHLPRAATVPLPNQARKAG